MWRFYQAIEQPGYISSLPRIFSICHLPGSRLPPIIDETLFSIQKDFATPLHLSESHCQNPTEAQLSPGVAGYSCSFKLPPSTYCHHLLRKETFFELVLDSKHFFLEQSQQTTVHKPPLDFANRVLLEHSHTHTLQWRS